jgi:hypothetical protein
LFIVREIAKAHAGEVTASSAEESISFTLRLPKVASPHALWSPSHQIDQTPTVGHQ